ncbi:unnamed protein product [Periconia digitata]|uniref:Uncharacterized protein n=1 Tax=Periconia digitata TaxID=1303443 RepID=A0A9W4UE03_9PLEO|nr:unnamed protein product [Periconia digitata]
MYVRSRNSRHGCRFLQSYPRAYPHFLLVTGAILPSSLTDYHHNSWAQVYMIRWLGSFSRMIVEGYLFRGMSRELAHHVTAASSHE